MRKIFKYTHPVTDSFELELPVGAIFRHVNLDPQRPAHLALWFEVDPDHQRVATNRTFHVFGTGHEIHDNAEWFRGTVIMDGFVWHIYEGPF